MSRHEVNVRWWPGHGRWPQPAPLGEPEQLTGPRARPVLVLAALPLRHSQPERLGLGAWSLVRGPTVLDAGLIVPNGIERAGRQRIIGWARRHPLVTPLGRRPPRVDGVSAFGRDVFAGNAYTGKCWIVGADLGRTLGLLAGSLSPSRSDAWRGAWTLHLLSPPVEN